MKCLYCGCTDSKVIDSRPTDEGSSIRRRRECMDCGKRFTTYEKIEELPMLVVKKDGRREPLDTNKMLGGVRKACEKRPVPLSDMEKLVDEVVRELLNSLQQEITSVQIGELIMEKLKAMDEVAYVRFASVYREFKDITTFMNELQTMMTEQRKPRK